MKSKTQHTPAPWTVRNGHGSPQIVGPDYRPNVGMGPICKMDRDYIPEVEAANARLIAAAPDLLDAAKAADCLFRGIHAHGALKPEGLIEWTRIKSAIANAEGGK